MTTRELTVYVEDANRAPIVGREVTCILKEPAIWGDAMIQNTTPLRELTNDNGRVIFNLIPSALFDTETPYLVDWLDLGDPYEVLMPNRNAILGRLVGDPDGPLGGVEIFKDAVRIMESASKLDFMGAGVGVVEDPDDDSKANITVPGSAGGAAGLYTGTSAYDAVNKVIDLTVPGHTAGRPTFGEVFYAIYPDDVPRSNPGTDLYLDVNTTTHFPLRDDDGTRIRDNDLTPERLYGVMRVSDGYRCLIPPHPRPQDYLIYAGFRVADADFTAADFTVMTPIDSNMGRLPVTVVNVYVGFAVPSNTGAIIGIQYLDLLQGPSLAGLAVGDAPITINGQEYQWIYSTFSWAYYLISGALFWVTQSVP